MFGIETMTSEMETKIHHSPKFQQTLITKQFNVQNKKKTKKYALGIILIFDIEEKKEKIILQKFCFSHFPIIES
jgi:hypothetical protein